MANRILSVYYAPEHSRQSDRDYISKLQPPVIRLLDPDVQQIADMHALAPNAIIAPRTWVIDDHDGAAVRNLMADPRATGRDHAGQYYGQLNRWQQEASQRGLKLPPSNRIYFNAANEPNQGGTPDKIAAYNIAFLDRCTELQIHAAALCLGVGWPDNTGPDTPVNWTPYAGIVEPIKRGNHWLELHEYHYKTGPQDGWRWLAGRHLQCPFDVPILLGEIGIDNYVANERWQAEPEETRGNRGWQGNVSPDQYAEMIERHIRGSDSRVVAALIFITDYRNNSWESFDTSAAHGALLARKDRMVPQAAFGVPPAPIETHLPVIEAPAPQEPTPTLTHPVQDPALRIISQRFGDNSAKYARFGLAGHAGVDFAVPEGTAVCAVDDGLIIEAEFDAVGYGRYIKMRHAWGESLYAHLSLYLHGKGGQVAAGEPIALSGNTGNSTGPHLHFAIRINPYTRGAPYDGFSDPLKYLDKATQPTSHKEVIEAIYDAAVEFGVEPELLLALAWAESSFDASAESEAGALGLFQIMPATWDEWSKNIGGTNPFDAAQNARIGAAYYAWLRRKLGNDWSALCAYNFGIGNVLNQVKPPVETVEFANKIVMASDLLKAIGG